MTSSVPPITDEQIDDFYRNHTFPTTGDATALFQAMLQATWVGLVGDPDTRPDPVLRCRAAVSGAGLGRHRRDRAAFPPAAAGSSHRGQVAPPRIPLSDL